ncbi:cobyric acid synthase [Aerococcaceae bacterium WGS1372]
MGKAVMIQGTASDVGKSIIVTGLCRIFANQGLKVFPFKSQNMALNSYTTVNGDEMSSAQLVQAEAARRTPDIRMNPILLKPVKDSRTKVIFNGKLLETLDAKAYYQEKRKLKKEIKKIYDEVVKENDLIIIEGAGSPAEINLNKDDFVNMGMAEIANSPVILVADIDRGGVFASIYGTIKLLSERDQKRVKGIIINKFRGDISLLDEGLTMIENLVDVPVIGVVPYIPLKIDSEDSLALDQASVEFDSTKDIDIAILKLSMMNNFTEFNSLTMFEDVSVRFVDSVNQLRKPDVLIIPNTEDVMRNQRALEVNGWLEKIKKLNMESTIIMTFGEGKKLVKDFNLLNVIELDPTEVQKEAFKENLVEDTHLKVDNKLISIEFEGLFEHLNWTRNFLNKILLTKGKPILLPPSVSYSEFKNNQYDILANHLRKHIDLEKLDKIINS